MARTHPLIRARGGSPKTWDVRQSQVGVSGDGMPLIGDQSISGLCMVRCRWRGHISKSCEWVPRGNDIPMVGSSMTGWRHSIGGRLISMTMVYGVLGREKISPTRGQTAICLYGRDWLNANLDHWLWGIQRGSAATPLSRCVVLPRTSCDIS